MRERVTTARFNPCAIFQHAHAVQAISVQAMAGGKIMGVYMTTTSQPLAKATPPIIALRRAG